MFKFCFKSSAMLVGRSTRRIQAIALLLCPVRIESNGDCGSCDICSPLSGRRASSASAASAANSHGVTAPLPSPRRTSPNHPPRAWVTLLSPHGLRGDGPAHSPPLHRYIQWLAGAGRFGTGNTLSRIQDQRFLVVFDGIGASVNSVGYGCGSEGFRRFCWFQSIILTHLIGLGTSYKRLTVVITNVELRYISVELVIMPKQKRA